MNDNHRYKEFETWIPREGGSPDNVGRVEAIDAESAAEAVASEYYNDGGYEGPLEIGIRDSDGVITKWEVTAEPTVLFWAAQMDAPDMMEEGDG